MTNYLAHSIYKALRPLIRLLVVLICLISSSQVAPTTDAVSKRATIPNLVSRLGESVLLPCGQNEHELLKQLQSSEPGMPVLVNWFKHYSLKRRSDKPIYAKYLANNIDYAPHISKDYESRLQVSDKINLNISDLKATDEALYECRLILFDKAYTDQQTGSMFYLQVYVAPEFEYPNEEIVYFNPSVPVRLYCYAKGKPAPTITWYKNADKLSANTSVLQEYLQDDSEDIFEYRCEAENLIGKIEHTVKVIRSGSLFFTQPLQNLTITEGTILNWPCLAQSNSDVSYKWFKDSISVSLGLHKWQDRGALFQDGMLYLLETYRNDSGFYECHAFTNNKRIETRAYLNIQYGPEIKTFQSPYYVLESSETVAIDCVVDSNPSIIALEWYKDKYLLGNTNKYQILPNNSLLIRNLQRADRGNYYCSCNNSVKTAVSSVINLEIISDNAVQTNDLFANDYSQFKLPCHKRKRSSNEIEWFKLNGQIPRSRSTISSMDGSLTLSNLELSDIGVYFCKLANSKIQSEDLENAVKLSIDSNDSMFHTTRRVVVTKAFATELPNAPTNIQIREKSTGVLVEWSHPKSTSAEIQHYQIYYREVGKISWKTTEPLKSDQESYFIDKSLLNNDKPTDYELKMISFSTYSKSLSSELLAFKFTPRFKALNSLNVYDFHTKQEYTEHTLDTKHVTENLSQLDMILILVFLAFVLFLLVSLIACVCYRNRSRRKKRIKQNLKADMEDWGFQSSAATATFLSSSSSDSDKSFGLFNKSKNKSKYNSAADSDVVTKIIDYKELEENGNLYSNLYTKIDKKTSQPKQLKAVTKPKIFFNENTTNNNNNNNTSVNKISKNEIPKSPKYYSPESVASSGIQSSFDDSNSDISIHNVPIRQDGFLTVNTIKYNAKTNILQQQKFSAKHLQSAKRNNIISEEDENGSDQASSLLNSDPKYSQQSPKSQEYYQWINENGVSDSAASETYSPSSIRNKNSAYNKSTSSTDSASHSPPFPVLNAHVLSGYEGSSLTMVSTRVPKQKRPNHECMSSDGSTTSSGCSSYEPKTMKAAGKVKRPQHPCQDYENMKFLSSATGQASPGMDVEATILRVDKKMFKQYPIYQSPLGTFKNQNRERFDYV